MGSAPTYVVVGANLAGGRAAETLRAEGFDGRVILIGEEVDRPYERPPLSKEYLRGEWPREKVFLRAPEYYEQQNIELRLGRRARHLDVSQKVVELETGERVRYDKLLLATGTRPRPLDVPGAGLEGVVYLRTLHDADALGEALRRQPRVLVVGAGFIGAEVAASARALGCRVTMLEITPVPLQRALGEHMGAVYAAFHLDQGVDLRVSASIAELRGAVRLEEAVTAAGDVIPCDLAVVGVGVVPVVDFLAGTGIAVSNGIDVDELCRANVPDIFAAGDVANWWHPTWQERLRVEHFDNAQNQGVAAAKSMLGTGQPYAPVPFFWSDQYDLKLQYAGHAGHWDEIVVRGRTAERSFSAFYLRDGRIRACLAVNRPKDVMAARRLIQADANVDTHQLADEDVNLRQLIPS